MERNAIVATLLVIFILLGYQWYVSHAGLPGSPGRVREKAPVASGESASNRTVSVPQPRSVEPELPSQAVTVDTPLLHVILSTMGARVTSWQLKRYPRASGSPVDLVSPADRTAGIGPLETWVDGITAPASYHVDRTQLTLTRGETGSVVFRRRTAAGLEVEKRLTFTGDRYDVGVDLTVRNDAGTDVSVRPRLAWGPGLRNSDNPAASTLQPPTLWLNGRRVQEPLAKVHGELIDQQVGWIALPDSYFTAALIPEAPTLDAFVTKGVDNQPIVGLVGAAQTLPPTSALTETFLVFAGPKDVHALQTVGHHLDSLVDLGWFWFLARPALRFLEFLYALTGSYGLAIILVSLLQKLAFFPLTRKSLHSMREMQALQPQVQALQERFKNHPQKKQEAVMALYRQHGVNPLGGCLPMVIQIPIMVALYNALRNSVAMWGAHFLWVRDLTRPDALFTVAWAGHVLSFNLLALLMGASMWAQQKLTPTGGDPRQAQMMLWTMPVVFTFMFWGFPSGLVLYWLVNNILQIGMQNAVSGFPHHPSAVAGHPA